MREPVNVPAIVKKSRTVITTVMAAELVTCLISIAAVYTLMTYYRRLLAL